MADEWRQELELATEAAVAAGEVLMRYFRRDVAVDRKAGGEPVTEADRESEALVIERLSRHFSDYGILSEEQSDRQSWIEYQRAWLIDPMDGTRDFVHGRAGFSVMIGLLDDGRPVLGVVHQPVSGVIYRGRVGRGAEMIDGNVVVAMRPSDITEPVNARLITSYSHHSERTDEMRRSLGITDEQRLGSVGLKVALIARGERDLYLNPAGHCKLWDTCAPEAILVAAGGRMTDLRGEALVYNDVSNIRLKAGIVASNGACHDAVIAQLAPFVPRSHHASR